MSSATTTATTRVDESSVRLRLVCHASASEQAVFPRQTFNDTLHEPCSFAVLSSRIEDKLQRGALELVYRHPSGRESPLSSDEDLQALQAAYRSRVSETSGTSTFRITVTASMRGSQGPEASAGGHAGAQHATGVQTRRGVRASASAVSSEEAMPPQRSKSFSAAPQHGAEAHKQSAEEPAQPSVLAPALMRKAESPGPAVRAPHKKAKTDGKDAETTVGTPVVAPASLCDDAGWEQQVLRSIAKTIDRHHWGSKLAAARPGS